MQALYKLVIADDDDEIRNGLFSYFPWNALGFDAVFQAEDGEQALAYVQTHSVDVLLCDIRMPRLTGLEVAEKLHASKDAPIIILLSAYQDFNYAKQAIAAGVHGYIVKSAKYDELLATFSELKKELDSKKILHDTVLEGDLIISTVTTVCHYIEKHYAEASLEKAAKLVYLSPFHLSRLFKQEMKITFSDYLQKCKMENAAQLLQTGHYKTYEVSSMVGYTNAKNFTRAFKSYYGMTPNEYRQGKRHSKDGERK